MLLVAECSMARRPVRMPLDLFLMNIWLRSMADLGSMLALDIGVRELQVSKCLPNSLAMPYTATQVLFRECGFQEMVQGVAEDDCPDRCDRRCC